MKLDNQILALIAVGASVAANCQPCLEHNTGTALKCGADSQEIMEAIEIGTRVRHGAAAKLDKFAASLNQIAPHTIRVEEKGCECNQSSQSLKTNKKN